MSDETRAFRTDLVLTVATGIGMADGLTFSDVQELIGWLAGGPVWTHQLPLMMDEAQAAAIAALGEGWEPYDGAERVQAYAARMVARKGATIQVAPADRPFHRGDAIMADAVELFGADRVVVVHP